MVKWDRVVFPDANALSDLPIVFTFSACDPNVGGTPPISSIPLSALGVLDGDGVYVPLLWNKVFVFNNNNNKRI